MTDLSNMTLAELEAEIERRKPEPDYTAWEPKWQAFREAMGWKSVSYPFTWETYIRALIAAHNTPLAGDDGWIPWTGGDCPVQGDTRVWMKFGDGSTARGPALRFTWDAFSNRIGQIIAYRVVQP